MKFQSPYCFLLPVMYILCIAGDASAQLKPAAKTKTHPSSAISKYSYVIIKGEKNTFGYNILNGSHVVIHQPNIPAVGGNKAFASKKDAEKTAKLALLKISHNIMPPTISIHELDSMHIRITHDKK